MVSAHALTASASSFPCVFFGPFPCFPAKRMFLGNLLPFALRDSYLCGLAFLTPFLSRFQDWLCVVCTVLGLGHVCTVSRGSQGAWGPEEKE